MGIRMSFQGAPWPNVLCTKGIHKGCNKKREMNRSGREEKFKMSGIFHLQTFLVIPHATVKLDL